MLSSKARILWIKYHAYLSCFFLPFAMLYALTGILYLLDMTGEKTTHQSIFIKSDVVLPDSEKSALNLYRAFRKEHSELPVKRHAQFWQDEHMVSWWDVHGEISLIPHTQPTGVKGYRVIVDEYDWLMHLHFIHKGLAGSLFKVLGILVGFSLLISIITGAVIALAMPKLKRWSVVSASAGVLVLALAFVLS